MILEAARYVDTYLQAPHIVAASYESSMNILCGCRPPVSCTCQREGHLTGEVLAPFDFPKLHACLPSHCYCVNNGSSEAVSVPAPPADFYLRPLAKHVARRMDWVLHLVTIELRRQETKRIFSLSA